MYSRYSASLTKRMYLPFTYPIKPLPVIYPFIAFSFLPLESPITDTHRSFFDVLIIKKQMCSYLHICLAPGAIK